MRVNSVDSTNFQMALKLNPQKMPEKLKEKPMEYIIALNEFGDRIKDVKIFDVVLEDSFIPQVKRIGGVDGKDYFKALKNEEKHLGKSYEVPAGFDGDTAGGFNPNEPAIFRSVYGKDAEKKYSEFKKLGMLEQAGELSRLLEKEYVNSIVKKARNESEIKLKAFEKQIEKENLDAAIDDLVSKYELPEAEKTNKKSWWKRIFG